MRAHHHHPVALTFVGFLLAFGVLGAAPAVAGGGGCHRDRQFGPTEAAGTTVDLVDFCMSTSVLRVDPGATVTFTNRDPAPHNLVGSGMYVDQLATGESVAFRFDDPGTFAYACTFHPAMVGAIAVGDGRRVAPPTANIVPVMVSSPAPPPTPTTLAVVPLGARRPMPTGTENEFPMAPVLLGVLGLTLALVALARRRVAARTPR